MSLFWIILQIILHGMIQNRDTVVVKDDKDSSIVIMKNSDYVTKLDTMIDDSIMKDFYIETTDSRWKGSILIPGISV